MPSKPKSDKFIRALSPRLRMIANGDDDVNAYRAEISSLVASVNSPPPALTGGGMALAAAQTSNELAEVAAPARVQWKKQKRLTQSPPADHAFVNVFLEFLRENVIQDPTCMAEARAAIERLQSKAGPRGAAIVESQNFLSATVPVSYLSELTKNPNLAFVHASEPLRFDTPASFDAGAPTAKKVAHGAAKHKDGEGILIGVIDVGGFDFAHPDFLDAAGNTRFLAIWDQGGTTRPSPRGYTYGALIENDKMNAAIAAAQTGLPATILEPQSEMSPQSHGTHVASIAAGKTGVCPKAQILGVLIDIPGEATERESRRATFSDASRIAHAVDYLLNFAKEAKKPISINISLGTNGGSHDGAGGVSRWIDSALATPGRCVSVAAGNAGQEKATSSQDMGWVMGRVHTMGRVAARDLEVDLEWVVIGNGIEDLSENELELWYAAQDRMQVSVQPPGETKWYVVKPREFLENKRLNDGTRLSIYNELYHPTNGINYISIYLSPNLSQTQLRGVRGGVWRVRLRGLEIRDGRFNAWIERDDPGRARDENGRRLMRFPSFFSEVTNVDSHSVSSLACGRWQITVGNLDPAQRKVNISSSQGPTRDGRTKPDLVAPGTAVVAASGFTPGERWTAKTGTSMASPYVCGVIGLMLAANPSLNAAQCAGILHRTAQPLPGADFQWRNDAGFGQIDAAAAIQEALTFNDRVPVAEGGN
ncbi:MAG: peptidase S8 and S53 subtilisin kexin sedolisin [Acidobacteria bacterium]|nr:peptidase S8 and S53 subtilisin kexin sedolisin [Acidobacteriota bacterium]